MARSRRSGRSRSGRVSSSPKPDLLVGLVAQHPEVVPRCDARDRVDGGQGQDRARRIVRRVHVDRDGPGGDARVELRFDIEAVATHAIEQRHLDRNRTAPRDDAADQRPVRRRQEHLVARIEKRRADDVEPCGRPGHDLNRFARDRAPRPPRETRRDRVEQARLALHRGVVVEARMVGGTLSLGPRHQKGLLVRVAHVQRVNALAARRALGGLAHEVAEDARSERRRRARHVWVARHREHRGSTTPAAPARRSRDPDQNAVE